MYDIILELLTDPLGLPVNDLWEYGILAVIGLFAFGMGWQVSSGGLLGTLIHWVVRFLAFLVLWAVTYALLAALQWVMAHMVLVCGTVVLGVAVTVIASVSGLRPYRRQYQEAA